MDGVKDIRTIILELERIRVAKMKAVEVYEANMSSLNEEIMFIREQCKHPITHLEVESNGDKAEKPISYKVCDICGFDFSITEDGRSTKTILD